MSRFIKLSNEIINTKYIRRIYYSDNKKCINVYGHYKHWEGITSYKKDEHPKDFEKLVEFMNRIW